jgi:hypothetical protein
MVAHAPGHGALLASGARLVGLALDAQVHDVVPAQQGTQMSHSLTLKEPEKHFKILSLSPNIRYSASTTYSKQRSPMPHRAHIKFK